MDVSASGLRVLVTAGGAGIGRAIAKTFLEHGARVHICDVDEAALAEAKREIPQATQSKADVARLDDVERLFADVKRELGGLDVLVNNAGISIRHPFLDVTPDEWRTVMRVNLDGVFFVAQQAARRMKAAGSGVILNMGSTNGLMGYPFYADYNASKAGVIELTRSMALELAPAVRVNAVCPGYIMTPMQEAEYTPEMIAAVDAKIPLGRHGRPEEVAALFAFLASDEAPFISGQTIVIDGAEIAGGLASR